MALKSRLYSGWIRHRRYTPRVHGFNLPLFMLYLDLDEIPQVFDQSRLWSVERFNWASFRRDDFFAPGRGDLKQAIIARICEESDLTPDQIQSIRMLTHVRYLGHIFNPVTVYFAFDKAEQLVAIMPEITNTPWKERFQYVLLAQADEIGIQPSRIHRHYREYRLGKAFHVSPFLPMDMDYRWVFGEPEDTLRIHLENHRRGNRVFDATLVMDAEHINAHALKRALIRFPWMTVKVAAGIHWHALRLWLKKVPFLRHPQKEQKEKKA